MRWGVIGVGIAGRARLGALEHMGEPAVAVYRGRFAPPELAVESAEDLLEKVDAVIVASPSSTHAKYVRRALLAGKHVVCEFPLASSEAEAEALYALADEQQRKLHVEHIELLAWSHRAMMAANASDVTVHMELASQGRTGLDLFLAHIARIHRAMALAGADCQVVGPRTLQGDRARVTLDLVEGERRHFAVTSNTAWQVEGRKVLHGDTVIPSPDNESLFQLDLVAARSWFMGGDTPYIGRRVVVRAYAVAQRLTEIGR